MKRFLTSAVVVCALLVFAIPAWSLTIVDVVQVDDFITSASLGPGTNDAAEEAWAEGETGVELTWLFKLEATQNWQQLTDFSNIFAHAVNSPYPLYFIFKTGAPNAFDLDNDGVDDTQFLFANIDAMSYLVVDLAAIGFAEEQWEVDVFSHVTGFDGTPVPEPGTMMLLGSGLVGLAGWGRKKFRK